MPSINPPAQTETNPLDMVLAVLLFVLPFVSLGLLAFGQNTIGYVSTAVMVVVVLAGSWMAVSGGKE